MEILRSKKQLWEKFYRTMEAQGNRSGRVITLTLNPCITETLIVDELSVGMENELFSMTADIGGLGIDVSRILAGCGYTAMCTGMEFSTDKKTLEQFLQMLKLPFQFAQEEGKMRSVVRILNRNGDSKTLLKEKGWQVSNKAVAELDRIRKKVFSSLKQGDVLVAGGSVPPGVPEDIYHIWIAEAKRKGIRTVFTAEGSLLEEGLKASPYVTVISKTELEKYARCFLDKKEDLIAEARKLLQQSVSIVCIFKKNHEILVVDEQNVWEGKAEIPEAVNDCGGTASVLAGICMALVEQKEDCVMQYIMAVLNGTLQKPGNGMCTSVDFERFFHVS